jgi:hypothetical protein
MAEEGLMAPRTIFLSKLIGLYYILISLAMILHKQETIETVTAMIHDTPLMLFAGIVAVFAGLAMVLGHNIWSGGATAVIVTLVGWIVLMKGASFLILPADALANFYMRSLHYEQFFYFYVGLSLLLGAYLTYSGFKARAY